MNRKTRFAAVRERETPEELCILLNANERRFCPRAYTKKARDCEIPRRKRVTDWLREPYKTGGIK